MFAVYMHPNVRLKMSRYFLILFVLSSIICQAFTEAEIRALALAEHSRDNLVSELEIVANAREYTVSIKMGAEPSKLSLGPPTRVSEETVSGKYIVSEIELEGTQKSMVFVLSYNSKLHLYHKWIATPTGDVLEMIGVGDEKTRSIAWKDVKVRPDGTEVLSIEIHNDKGVVWKETILRDGKSEGFVEGEAKKLR